MPRVQLTESELWNKDQLESLFWIEIAKRKQMQEDMPAYCELLQLRSDIQSHFEKADGGNGVLLAEDGMGVEIVFSRLQGLSTHSISSLDENSTSSLNAAEIEFGDKINTIIAKLPYLKGFRLADFSTITNLKELNDWWNHITSTTGRSELKALGQFSSIGEKHLARAADDIKIDGSDDYLIRKGEDVETIVTMRMPVAAPSRVVRERVRTHTSEESTILIDGEPLTNHIILSVPINEPLPPFWQIERAFHLAHSRHQSQRIFEALDAGDFTSARLQHQPETMSMASRLGMLGIGKYENKLMREPRNFKPIVFGLQCWDGVFKGKKLVTASEEAVEAMGTNGRGQYFRTPSRVQRDYNNVIKPHIDQYQPKNLPWADDI